MIWPGALAVLVAACAGLACKIPSPINLLLMISTVAAGVVAGAGLLAFTIFLALAKTPRRAASILAAIVLPVLVWRPILWATDYVHLALTAGLGIGHRGQLQSPDPSRFEVYDWSTGFAGSNTFLIRDAADEIALPAQLHRHPLSDEQGFGESCAGRSDHLMGHYYVCSF